MVNVFLKIYKNALRIYKNVVLVSLEWLFFERI